MNLPITLKSIVVQVQIGDAVYPLTLGAASAGVKVPAFTGTTGTVSVTSAILGDKYEPRKHYTHSGDFGCVRLLDPEETPAFRWPRFEEWTPADAPLPKKPKKPKKKARKK